MRQLAICTLVSVSMLGYFAEEPAWSATVWPSFQADLQPGNSTSSNKANLPDNISIQTPSPDLPDELSAYSGIWKGWMCRNAFTDVKVAIKSVSSEGAAIGYSVATDRRKSSYQEFQANFDGRELEGFLRSGSQIFIGRREDGSLNIKWVSGRNNKRWCTGILSRVGQVAASPRRVEKRNCIIERVNYQSDGLRIDAYIIRPKGEGPFPVVIWNHGSKGSLRGGRIVYDTDRPTVNMNGRCWKQTRDGIVVFVPEGRGYGSSEGEKPGEALRGGIASFEGYIVDRARDVNAGVRWLMKKPYVAKNCMVLQGASHGGAVSIIAAPYLGAPDVDYRTVVAIASGVFSGPRATEVSMADMKDAISKTKFPIHLWHAKNDTTVTPEVSRELFSHGKETNRDITYKEFDGIEGRNGHGLFRMRHYQIWGSDYEKILKMAFKDCV